ncbi:MAG: response regulator transcription factor [Candidatus Methylacidiphilales bacterium]
MTAARTEEAMILRLYEAMDIPQFAQCLFALVESRVPNCILYLTCRPGEFDLPCQISRPEMREASDAYIAEDHKYDIWLQRSPVGPNDLVVRHSDYTPREMVLKSEFYRRTMSRFGAESGTSITAWRGNTWLGTLTVFRSAEQGDTTDEELALLAGWQVHFASCIKRLAKLQESRLAIQSLETFVWALPTAVIILDWELRVIHHNAAAVETCEKWRMGEAEAHLKRPKRFIVPGEVIAAVELARPSIPQIRTANAPLGRGALHLLSRRCQARPHLEVRVDFVPAKSLSLSRGSFLITFTSQSLMPDEPGVREKVRSLTRRERQCADLVAAGCTNVEIARKLGTSPITVRNQISSAYEKLGISRRHELIALWKTLEL